MSIRDRLLYTFGAIALWFVVGILVRAIFFPLVNPDNGNIVGMGIGSMFTATVVTIAAGAFWSYLRNRDA